MRFMVSLVLFAFCGCINSSFAQQREKVVTCYFSSWAYERPGYGRYDVADIDPNLCTHLIYAFAVLDEVTYTMVPFEPDHDIPTYTDFNALDQLNPNLKTLIAIGGWADGSMKYSEMVSDPERRQNFATSALEFVQTYGFDGLDLDWEYPGGRPGEEEGLPNDKENFVALITELRALFEPQGLLLTAAVSAGQTVIDQGYDVQALDANLDYIHVMTYDYHGWWWGHDYTGHNSPLYTSIDELDPNHPGHNLNTDWSILYWINSGASPGKLVLGVGTYGRGFVLADANDSDLYAPAVDAVAPERYTNESGYWGFNEFCERRYVDGENDMWTVTRLDGTTTAPYAVKGTDWFGYDDPISAQIKAEYALVHNLGGVFVWSMDTDDFQGNCQLGNSPIINSLKQVMAGGV